MRISINSSNLRLKRSLRLLLHYELGALSLRYLRLRDYHCWYSNKIFQITSFRRSLFRKGCVGTSCTEHLLYSVVECHQISFRTDQQSSGKHKIAICVWKQMFNKMFDNWCLINWKSTVHVQMSHFGSLRTISRLMSWVILAPMDWVICFSLTHSTQKGNFAHTGRLGDIKGCNLRIGWI